MVNALMLEKLHKFIRHKGRAVASVDSTGRVCNGLLALEAFREGIGLIWRLL